MISELRHISGPASRVDLRAADSRDGARGTLRGIWEALRERLNPAHYRPLRSPAVEAVPLPTRRGDRYYVLANPRHSKYMRLAAEEYHLWTLMDGARSVKDLIFEYFTTFGVLTFDRVAWLVLRLRRDSMLADAPPDVFASVQRLLQRRYAGALGTAWQLVTGQRTIQIRRIDRLIGGVHRYGGWLLFTTPMQVLYAAVSLVGGWLFLQHLASGRYDLLMAGGSYAKGLALLVLLNLLSIMVHEMCHALTCKHYGARVNGAGIMLYYGLPAYFTDTTDVWTKPAYARIATSWAGPYSGVILSGIGAIIVQALPASPIAPILHRLSFLWMLSLVFNLIPLLEFDGYFMLVDWLEFPMLRARALTFCRKELWQKVRRGEAWSGQERLLAFFGGLALVFSVLVVIGALFSWQYRLKALTQALWGGGIGARILLVSLLALLSLPLALRLGTLTISTARSAISWMGNQWRTPRGHGLWERENLLREIHFLSPLSKDERSAVAIKMAPQVFGPGEAVFRQGTEGDRFYVIAHGVAEVWVADDRAPRRYLARGDYFGEVALVDRVPHVVTVRAHSLLRVLWLDRGDFDRLVADHIPPPSPVADRLHMMETLRQFPVFGEMGSRELDALASMLCLEQIPSGAVVFQEGKSNEIFYLVNSGQVEVVEDGDRTRILGRGTCFGEIAAVPNLPRRATVRALTPLEVFKLCRPDFDRLAATTLRKAAAALEESRLVQSQRARRSRKFNID